MDIKTSKIQESMEGYIELDLTSCTKEQIRDQFETIYRTNEILFSSLKDESVYYKMPDRLRLPLIFYFGHTASVYINKLMLAGMIKERVNLGFETLFETGVDEFSWDDLETYRFGGNFVWPTPTEVSEYRRKVKEVILKCIEETPLSLPIDEDSPWWAVMMGISHECIHIETSSVLIRLLPVGSVKNVGLCYGPVKSGTPVIENSMVKCNATDVTYGRPDNCPKYDWDCSYGGRTCRVEAFEASQYLITNRQFLEFVEDKGYEKKQYWTEEGWQWRQYRNAIHPTFWICDKGCKNGSGGDLANKTRCVANDIITEVEPKYKLRLMFDEIALPLDWPVEVNYHEAKAFCKWKGPEYRLPIEAERHVMIGEKPVTDEVQFHQQIKANVNLKHGSPTPVNMYPPSSRGFYDLYGNVWEWHEDSFNGYPGFKTQYLYDDYSSPCFDGKHNVIRGGSWISLVDQGGQYCRNGFRRHFFQHAGFRVVRNVDTAPVDLPVVLVESPIASAADNLSAANLDRNRYRYKMVKSANRQLRLETDDERFKAILENEYLGDEMPKAVEIVNTVIDTAEMNGRIERALFVGCETGRGAFHLAKYCDEIIAVDYCARYVNTAQTIQTDGRLVSTCDMPEIYFPEATETQDNLLFKQFHWLPNEVGSFQLVILCGIDRLTTPKAWMARFNEIIECGGFLAVSLDKNAKFAPELLSSYLQRSTSFQRYQCSHERLFMWQKIK
ncbi:uncharacterized protein LOC141908054 [Tubulanus polymorphus]|uniref:uncharacterized protein LOC141908054 n=1 Tax=Tubulanus polymorphus TaxID=672921 RepID=UPI003DA5B6CC